MRHEYALNKSLSKYFLQFLFTKIVIPAQAGIGTLNCAMHRRMLFAVCLPNGQTALNFYLLC